MKKYTRSSAPIKRAIVTGGLGFIGAVLCKRLLAQHVHVLVIDNHLFGRRKDVLPPHPNLSIANIDIRDRAKVMRAFHRFKPDTVFHLAAIAFIPACMERPAEAVSVHLDGTLNILEAATIARVHHVQFASSAAVYTPEHVLLSEEKTPTRPPADVYGITKLAGELFVEKFHRKTGTHTVMTRSFNVYGPQTTNRFLIPNICEQIRAGATTLHLGNLSVSRDYVHVEDAVEAILQLMQRTSGLVTVNIGSGKKTSIRELVTLCARIAGRKIRVVSDKKLQRPKATDRLAWRADLRRLRSLIDWSPRYSLQRGLTELLRKTPPFPHS